MSKTNQFRYDFFTGRADKSQSFEISSISLGLAKRLSVPDDYFLLSQAITYQYFNLNNYFTGLFTFGDGVSNNINYTVTLSRNIHTQTQYSHLEDQISVLVVNFLPLFTIQQVDYSALGNNPEFQTVDSQGQRVPDQSKIDQEKFKFLEFYKIKFSGSWFTRIVDKLVLRTQVDFGFLGTYNNEKGDIPFERFYVGGDGMNNTFALDGEK